MRAVAIVVLALGCGGTATPTPPVKPAVAPPAYQALVTDAFAAVTARNTAALVALAKGDCASQIENPGRAFADQIAAADGASYAVVDVSAPRGVVETKRGESVDDCVAQADTKRFKVDAWLAVTANGTPIHRAATVDIVQVGDRYILAALELRPDQQRRRHPVSRMLYHERTIAQFVAFADAMCQCAAGDTECAQRVVDDQRSWGEELAKDPDRNDKPDPNLAKRFEPIMNRYVKCATSAMTPTMPPPSNP